MPRQEQNGTRNYLADEVRAFRERLDAHTAEINDLKVIFARSDVALATLLEESRRSREQRQTIYDNLQAGRAETAQVMQSVTAVQAETSRLSVSLGSLTKTVNEIDDERKLVKGAANLVKSISGAGWGMVGLIAGGILTAAGFLARHWPGQPPTPPGHP